MIKTVVIIIALLFSVPAFSEDDFVTAGAKESVLDDQGTFNQGDRWNAGRVANDRECKYGSGGNCPQPNAQEAKKNIPKKPTVTIKPNKYYADCRNITSQGTWGYESYGVASGYRRCQNVMFVCASAKDIVDGGDYVPPSVAAFHTMRVSCEAKMSDKRFENCGELTPEVCLSKDSLVSMTDEGQSEDYKIESDILCSSSESFSKDGECSGKWVCKKNLVAIDKGGKQATLEKNKPFDAECKMPNNSDSCNTSKNSNLKLSSCHFGIKTRGTGLYNEYIKGVKPDPSVPQKSEGNGGLQ